MVIITDRIMACRALSSRKAAWSACGPAVCGTARGLSLVALRYQRTDCVVLWLHAWDYLTAYARQEYGHFALSAKIWSIISAPEVTTGRSSWR